MNFLARNYRPKCDMCSNLCDIDWYMQTEGKTPEGYSSDSLLICDQCMEKENFPQGLTKENFELANLFSIVNPSESKFHLTSFRI